jgi:hypothetical protein
MEVNDLADMIYIITVFSLNGLGFIIVVICYVQIYLNLGNQDFTKPHTLKRDMVVAKKMALLVSLCKVCANLSNIKQFDLKIKLAKMRKFAQNLENFNYFDL